MAKGRKKKAGSLQAYVRQFKELEFKDKHVVLNGLVTTFVAPISLLFSIVALGLTLAGQARSLDLQARLARLQEEERRQQQTETIKKAAQEASQFFAGER